MILSVLRPGVAALVLHLVLVLPNHPGAMTFAALRLFPLELPFLLLAMLALPWGRGARWICTAVTAVLLLLTMLKLGDLASFVAFDRRSNPLADLGLLDAAWSLASGALGAPLAAVALAGLVAGLAALAGAIWWALAIWARLPVPVGMARLAGVAAVLAGCAAVAEAGERLRLWPLPLHPPGDAFTLRTALEHAHIAARTRADLAGFRRAALTDPLTGQPGPLARLAGRDVLVIFVESYARLSIDHPLYAPTHRATLRRATRAIDRAGLAMASGTLLSPIEGGQSWLAHATLASGLTVDSQPRHAALLASPRRTLWQIAADAGFHTVAVAPAITRPWPEAGRLGFQTVLDRDAMRYDGLPFNWVTMPDQFTLARWRDRLEPVPATPIPAAPIFAKIMLISSHAPWVPVPRLIDWDAVGDGRVFDTMARADDAPEVVWRDPARVRDQYRLSLDYALQTVFDYAARQGDRENPPLMLVLGDHPPAAFVSQGGGPGVPFHLIGPPDLLAAVQGWGLTPGLIPDATAPVWPMAGFRDRFVTAFSAPP